MTEQFDLNSLENTLRADKDDAEEMTEQFDLNAFDGEDILIVDNTQDEADENITAMADSEAAGSHRDEDLLDLEEEIELEFESDEDEDELIELDDERAEDNQDFVDLMLGVSKESDQSDDDDKPAEYLEFETEKRDDIIVSDADRDPDTEVIDLAEDEAPKFVDSDDLPDLEAISGLDFEIEEDEEDSLTIDEHETDSSDDIIARAVQQSLSSDDDREPVDLADEAEFGLEDDDALLDLDGSKEDDEEILALAEKEPLSLGNDEDLLDWDEETDLEADDEIIPLDGFNDLEAEDGEDIIEITEFDQHFPADSEALLKQSGILDASKADEEDFLELIDIEEDSLSDDEEIIEFSDSPATIEDDKINQSFSDDLEEDQLETVTPESIFSADLADKTLENELTDFDFDPSSIAQQADRLDTFLSEDAADEPKAVSLPVDQVAEKEKTGLEDSQTGLGMDELPTVPTGQIEAAIERIISEKFSGKIENIIYEVIEKAVAKEIDRLKGALLGSNTFDDNQD
jgi:hypothetical protein